MDFGRQPRILFLDTVYSQFLRENGFDRRPPGEARYDTALTHFMRLGFGTSDAMSQAFSSLGWTARDVIANSRYLQTLWLRQQGGGHVLPWGWRRGWRVIAHPVVRGWLWRLPHIQGLVQARVAAERPDVLYVHDLELLGAEQLRSLRPYVRLLVGQCGVALPDPKVLQAYDLLVSSLPSNVHAAEQLGVAALLMPQAFDARVLDFRSSPQRDIDVSFVGSFSRRHTTTESLLLAVGEACPNLRVFGAISETALKRSGLSRYYAGPAWGKDMYDVMFRSKIALNRHIALAGPYAVNMRMFEATGCGALLLTEARANLNDYFTPEVEAVTYTTAEEAALRASTLLRDPQQLSAIAHAGQTRTLRDHTYTTRMAVLAEELAARLT